MSWKSANSRLFLEESMAFARASQAPTPKVLPERSIEVVFVDSRRGLKCGAASSSVFNFKPLPASEKVAILSNNEYVRVISTGIERDNKRQDPVRDKLINCLRGNEA